MGDEKVVLHLGVVPLGSLKGVLNPAIHFAFVKMMGFAITIVHVDQQHIAVARLGKRGGQAGRRGGHAGALAATGHRHQFRLVGQVYHLEVGHQTIPQRVEKRPQLVPLIPRGHLAADGLRKGWVLRDGAGYFAVTGG